MTTPPDQTQRQHALDPRRSFIVQAPAGSGKTSLLVRRYLALLARVEAPEQILAITFTRKATAEMRERIVHALRQAEAGGGGEGDDAEMRALGEAALANDAKHGWEITANTRRLRIQTIDSLCSELVRRMPWSARFGAAPEIIDDPAPLYRQAAALTLNHIEDGEDGDPLAQACRRLLAWVDADWNRAQSLLAGMLEKRDKWMGVLGTDTPMQMRARLEEMWRQVVEQGLRRLAAMIPPTQQAEIMKLGAFAAENLLADGESSPLAALHEAANFPEADHRHLDQWHAIAALLLTGTGGLRKRVDKRHGFPAGAGDKARKTQMTNLLAWCAQQPALEEALGEVRLLPPAQFSDAQWETTAALLQLLRLAAGELQLLFKARNQADFIELTQRAELALGDADAPSDLALTFDYELSHLLVDEFQDTSSAHIGLLEKLTEGWQPDDGRTLFFVGDPMQSIYRFRGAEVGNFLNARQDGLGDISLEAVSLSANFRSAPPLVAWFNRTFEMVLPEEDDLINSAVRYTPAHAAGRDQAACEVHVHPAIKRAAETESEAEAVATCVAQALAHDADQSIAVLGRVRAHLRPIATALRRRGIPFQAVDLVKLNDRPAIRDLTALTRALVQPADRVAWLSLLRAPWCGLALADITALVGDDHAATLVELWEDEERVSDLSEEGRARLGRLTESLAAALHRRGRIGLRQNVEAAWLSLGGPATVGSSDLDDCRRYLDLLDQLESQQIEITPDNLRRAGEDLWARGGDGSERVQLLSIHKAKGLEFDSVILPSLQRRPRGEERTLLRWRALPEQLLIAPLPPSTDRDDPLYRYLEHLDKHQARHELGRLLYVACTRARKNLHLFGTVAVKAAKSDEAAEPASTSLLALLWPQVWDSFDEIAAAADEDDDAAGESEPVQSRPPPRPLHRLPLAWTPPELPQNIATATTAPDVSDSIEFNWVGETARIVGIVIHRILQQVDEIGWENWQRRRADESQRAQWRTQLRENGIAEPDLAAALERVEDAVDKARRDSRAAWLFSAAHRDIRREWPLAGWVDGRVVRIVVDRSFIDENGVRWIVDFKSSHHQGAGLDEFLDEEQARHREQLSRYATIVGQLQPGEIRLGLYFPALQGWREWAA